MTLFISRILVDFKCDCHIKIRNGYCPKSNGDKKGEGTTTANLDTSRLRHELKYLLYFKTIIIVYNVDFVYPAAQYLLLKIKFIYLKLIILREKGVSRKRH